MKIQVDLATCKAYANCMIEAPDHFDFNDTTGKVMILKDEVESSEVDEVKRAISSCPVSALSLSD